MIDSNVEIPYNDIDYEIVDLIKYLNMFDGIQTTESCCGHNISPCQIWFDAESVEALNDLIFTAFDNDILWEISINTADFPEGYKYLRLVLSSGEYKSFPTVGLMIDNLTYRLKTKLIKKGKINE